ncbi:hypothetical protein M0813_10215 [Anaeramoeba flamelloides]|uniref:Uncharacterized protein n=1 Tax=Anaeramoeba flamelloides TaxID=1746091 RepID=A0ABQ8X3B2_9EUKA|nr:hypothetical protein M0813_10215 [Anaeramoeba flamelloides]
MNKSTHKNQTPPVVFNYNQTNLLDLLSLYDQKELFSQTYKFYVAQEEINFENENVVNRSIWVSKEKEYSPNSDIVAIILHSSTYLPEKFENDKKKKKAKKGKGKGKTVIDQNGKKKKKKLITKLKLKPKQMVKEREKEKRRLMEKPLGILITFRFLQKIPPHYVMYRKNGIRSRYSSKSNHFPVIVEESQLVLKQSMVPTRFKTVKNSQAAFASKFNVNARKRGLSNEETVESDGDNSLINFKIRQTLNRFKKTTRPKFNISIDEQIPKKSRTNVLNNNAGSVTNKEKDTKHANKNANSEKVSGYDIKRELNHNSQGNGNHRNKELNDGAKVQCPLDKNNHKNELRKNEKEILNLKTEFFGHNIKFQSIISDVLNNGSLNNFNTLSSHQTLPKKQEMKNALTTPSINFFFPPQDNQDLCLEITNKLHDFDYDFNFNSNTDLYDDYFVDFYEDVSQNKSQVCFNY